MSSLNEMTFCPLASRRRTESVERVVVVSAFERMEGARLGRRAIECDYGEHGGEAAR